MKALIKLIFLVLLISIPVFSYAGTNAEQVLNDAKVIYKKADALQGGWISTQQLIKDAQGAITKKNQKKALMLAKKAKLEAQLSLDQAQDQLKNWAEPAYIK